ncbi:unnamed protein product [Miscanthus lutarioriparius]|uniref:BHLH domain-containing protein n=1 Tax=Miscanthus lutarioriparius TaxID=422564 RepID=A0A811RAW0_9POAL|nr:unnamed protein product [Miscanthus lutarioriparius]
MASWLFPIVCGQEFAGGGDDADVVAGRRAWVDDDQMVPSRKESKDHKLQHAACMCAFNLHMHRRRWKIKEKLKTLQQLVPGCDNSNLASTLDQTIRYMKSLQQHIQAMSTFRAGMKPTSVAVYPVVQQAPCLACLWQGGTSVGAGMARRSPAIIPFCAHVSMGSPSPPCSHDV